VPLPPRQARADQSRSCRARHRPEPCSSISGIMVATRDVVHDRRQGMRRPQDGVAGAAIAAGRRDELVGEERKDPPTRRRAPREQAEEEKNRIHSTSPNVRLHVSYCFSFVMLPVVEGTSHRRPTHAMSRARDGRAARGRMRDDDDDTPATA